MTTVELKLLEELKLKRALSALLQKLRPEKQVKTSKEVRGFVLHA